MHLKKWTPTSRPWYSRSEYGFKIRFASFKAHVTNWPKVQTTLHCTPTLQFLFLLMYRFSSKCQVMYSTIPHMSHQFLESLLRSVLLCWILIEKSLHCGKNRTDESVAVHPWGMCCSKLQRHSSGVGGPEWHCAMFGSVSQKLFIPLSLRLCFSHKHIKS